MKIQYTWKCKYCDFIAKSRRKLQKHHKDVHHFERYKNFPAWNKGLTKESDERVAKIGESVSKSLTGKPGHKQTLETRNKISNTANLNKKSGGYRKGSGKGKKGWYKNYFCDSSWELAFVIFNLEHGIEFERNYKTFLYEYKGKIRKYMPDWKINGEYVEIKGYCSDQWDAKLKQFPKDETLKVITEFEIKPYLDYVIEKYGTDFIKLYN